MSGSRIAGALYGALIGDALGVPYEFHAPGALPPEHLLEMSPPPGFERAHRSVPPGTWSDDGALMLALLDSLGAVQPFDVSDFARRMLAWWREGQYTPDGQVFDIGIQTRTALANILAGADPLSSGPAGVRDNGNGALMRVLPVAFVAQGDADAVRLARLQGLPTHGHLTSHLCCAYYVLIARRLLAGQGVAAACDEAASALALLLEGHEADAFMDILSARERGKGTGYVVDCLWSALDVVGMAGSYEDAVRAAVALGHDTDTTACVTGGLAGALWGLDGIPLRWVETLRGRAIVDALLARVLSR